MWNCCTDCTPPPPPAPPASIIYFISLFFYLHWASLLSAVSLTTSLHGEHVSVVCGYWILYKSPVIEITIYKAKHIVHTNYSKHVPAHTHTHTHTHTPPPHTHSHTHTHTHTHHTHTHHTHTHTHTHTLTPPPPHTHTHRHPHIWAHWLYKTEFTHNLKQAASLRWTIITTSSPHHTCRRARNISFTQLQMGSKLETDEETETWDGRRDGPS